MKNNREIINTYNSIYEKLYSFDEVYLEKKKKIIKKNLKEMKINNFTNLEVMDVGT